MMNTIVAHPAAGVAQPRLARSTGTAGGWVSGIAWVLLGLGLLVAAWFGWAGWQAGGDSGTALMMTAAGVAAGTLVQFLFLFSYGLLLRGMAHLIRRVG